MGLPKLKRPKLTLGRVNTVLLVAIIVLDLYVILAPLAPSVLFWWQSNHTQRKQQLTAQLHANAPPGTSTQAPTNQPNHVVIPSMLLDQPILEGPVSQQYSILDKGIWRWPEGSTPDKGGNTTLVGHRFTYTNPRGVFYFLNKVSLGDEIGVFWNGKEYLYKVTSINQVPPTDTAIEDNTPDARLTLFTCTPLYLPKDRLVVVAELEHAS